VHEGFRRPRRRCCPERLQYDTGHRPRSRVAFRRRIRRTLSQRGGQMPHSAIFRSSDPYEHQRSLRAEAVDLIVTAPGDFRGEATRIDVDRLWLQRGRESLPRIVHATVSKTRNGIFFLADAQQAPTHHTGKEFPPGCMMVYSAGAEHHHRSSAACHWAAMSLDLEDLAAAGRAITGRDLTAPKTSELIRPPVPLMDRLLRLHAAAGDLAATAPDILAHPGVAKAIAQELIRVMVGCLTDGGAERINSRRQRLPIMRRFERMLEANPGKPLYLAEICAAIGVPARTFRHYCWQHLGMSPHRYLWLRRMNLARRALVSADPTARTVAEVATAHGFWELGRFSVAFRKLFGESPSVTLRRSADPKSLDDRAWALVRPAALSWSDQAMEAPTFDKFSMPANWAQSG
jgi:AraC-like DNA-binding protein